MRASCLGLGRSAAHSALGGEGVKRGARSPGGCLRIVSWLTKSPVSEPFSGGRERCISIGGRLRPYRLPSGAMSPPGSVGSGVIELPEGVEAEEQLLQALAAVPAVAKAWCLPKDDGAVELRVQQSQRNLPANKARTFTVSAVLPSGWTPGGSTPHWSWPVENGDALFMSFSPSGKHLLVVKAGPADSDSALLELWSQGRLLSATVVPRTLHGPVVNDGYFAAGAAWSPDETRIVYTAEAPVVVKCKKFGVKKTGGGAGEGAVPSAAAPTWEGVGPWEEDWGELNVGKRPPALFLLKVEDMSVAIVPGLPEDTSCGQPVWDPSGDGIVFVGWAHQAINFPQSAMRLGVVYCYNRPCHLWRACVDDNGGNPAVCLTEELASAHAPRFSPDGSKLVFLSWQEAASTGVHNSTAALMSLDWPKAGPAEVVVPALKTPDVSTGFPGIYAGFGNLMLDNPFLDDGDTLVLGTQWRSTMAIVSVSLSSKTVSRLTPSDGARPSFSLLAVHEGLLVSAASGPCAPPQVMVARAGEGGVGHALQWHVLPLDPAASPSSAASSALSSIEHHVLQISPSMPGLTDLPFEAIVLRPKDADKGPTVLMPHGGPHHAYPNAYLMPFAFMAASGYTVVLVNFRGSTGFGEDCIQSLPGNIGTLDVSDCMDALAAAVAEGYSDPARVAVCGGSHGGFLTGHLVGQHPSKFRAGILRNPVMDLGLMVYCSDIPDWVFVETWGTTEGMAKFKPRPDEKDLDLFYQMSPIRHVDSVTAPLLFMLGAKDHRVTWNDARHYMSTLQSRSGAPPVSAYVFPEDTHALDRPQTEFEQWLCTVSFLKLHCGRDDI